MILLTGATHPVGCAAPELVAGTLAVAGRAASPRVAPKVVSVAVQVTIAQLFSLVAHANLALAKVVSGEVAQAVVSGVLQDNVAGLEFLHLRALSQEAGDADQVTLGTVEREILVVDGECGLDHVNDSVWVALSSWLSWEDVGDAAVEEAVHASAVADVVVEVCRLVANLDADTWGNALLVGEASLCVQGEAAAKDLGVDGVKAVDLVGNLDHDLIS